MNEKYVKDRNHNRFPAYCCEDIDADLGARVKALEEALEGLVAGIMPDGSVTLAKLAADARSYRREINKGLLFCEWIGTQEEYDAHVEENGGEPLANVRYTITDDNIFSEIPSPDFSDVPIGAVVVACTNFFHYPSDVVGSLVLRKTYLDGEYQEARIFIVAEQPADDPTLTHEKTTLSGKWLCLGQTAADTENAMWTPYLFQRIE